MSNREGRDKHVAETMGVVEIVPITEAHIESFHRALDFVARERRYLAFLEAPPLDVVRAFILNNIRHNYPQLVALSDGDVVGWCDVLPNPRPINAHVGVLGMGLLPEFRRQGLGKRLMAQTLDASRAFGLHRIELTVRKDNEVAIELYKKFGFKMEGLQRHAVLVDGSYEDVVMMAMLL